MLTSKLITEIIGNHSQFYVCTNSCNKFASSRSRQIMKLHIRSVMYGHALLPLSKGRGAVPS